MVRQPRAVDYGFPGDGRSRVGLLGDLLHTRSGRGLHVYEDVLRRVDGAVRTGFAGDHPSRGRPVRQVIADGDLHSTERGKSEEGAVGSTVTVPLSMSIRSGSTWWPLA